MKYLKHLVWATVFASLLFGCSGGDSSSGLDQSRTEITEESEELTVDEPSAPITEESEALTVAEPSIEIIDEDEELFVDESDPVEQTASSFKVTTPNGGQKWTTGKSYAIKWTKGKAGATVKIQLLKSNKHYKWISKKTKNDGKLVWKIPTTVVTSSAYKIKITSVKNKKVFDKSNKNFKITKTGGGGSSSLKVTTPNGSQKWTTGKSYAIKWSKGNAGAKVKILLLKNGKAYKWITKSTKNDGKHAWKIPANIATASTYKIKITSTTKKKVTDSSNKTFRITRGAGGGTPKVTLSCTPSSFSEISGTATCTLRLSKKATKAVTVKLSYSGKATAGTDYSGNKTTHTISAGKTSNSWKLTGKSDTKTEGNETIVINVASVTNATEKGTQRETLTLTDGNSTTPTVSLSCNSASFAEISGTATCTLRLSKKATKAVTVKLSYSGKATAGTDYSGNKTTHTISAGKTSNSWKLTGKSDTKTEGNETIVINVASVTNATEKGTQRETLTLTDGATSTTLRVSSPNGGEKWTAGQRYSIRWSDKGAGNVKIELLNSGRVARVISKSTKNDGLYKWRIPSTLKGGESYRIRITSTVESDDFDSSDKNFSIVEVGTIPTVSLSCTPDSASESGGQFTCTLSLSNATSDRVTVEMAYSGTATAGTDYSNARRTRVIKAGRTSSTWTLTGKNDSDSSEGDETIVVDIDSVTNAIEDGTQQASLTLADSGAPTVSLSCTPDSASESGGQFTCTLSLSNATSDRVTVEMAYSGTATAGTDYSNARRTRVIKAGRTSSTWTLTGKNDSDSSEGDETIVVDIDSVTNAIEDGTQQASLTLTDSVQ